ncbi:unnamed protein product [Colias eurytheme]|nr:unnamed protein product [Colias eurytheme]
MFKLKCLLIVIIACGEVLSYDEQRSGFVPGLDFENIFNDENSGIISLASNPIAAAMLKADKSQYPKLFDTIVSSSIDSLQSQTAPKENIFDAQNFGFIPIASQNFPHQANRKSESESHQRLTNSNSQQNVRPLRYNIQTVHDANYKVFKPEENEDGVEILEALKKNPTVAAYFQPLVNAEVSHPLHYRREDAVEQFQSNQNYKSNPYIAGPVRIRRYTRGRSRDSGKKRNDEEDDDPYGYRAEYISIPKAFGGSLYSSPYKEKKDSDDKYEYPYKYDSGYDHKEYDRIKELSEKQAAEIRQNPGNCKEVKRDGMKCMTCKDPKTGGNYESCSYEAEPKNNKYAYSKERKFDSNDEPDDKEDSSEKADQPNKAEKYKESQEETAPQKFAKLKDGQPSESDNSGEKYKSYYVHTSNPKPSAALRASSEESSAESKEAKPYDYKKALPGFYTDNEPKKDVENVLAEFKKKDRSACKKVHKNGMTCFQCLDKSGLKHEECMFVSESAPKQSHLAYQEVKEFTSKPTTLDSGNEGAESKTITTSTPPKQKSAAYTAEPSNNKKVKRKKASQAALVTAATNPVAQTTEVKNLNNNQKIKRSPEAAEKIESDGSKIAPPEEFAGADSKGAFWADTMPRYSSALGVTLPEYMLSRSEHENSFDELVAGA